MKIENLLIKLGIGFCSPAVILLLLQASGVYNVYENQGMSSAGLFVIGLVVLVIGCGIKYKWDAT